MRTLDPAITDALAAGSIKARWLVWITARNRDTDADETAGFWSDVEDVSVSVIDALTRGEVVRTFCKAGSALTIGTLSLTSDLTVRELEVGLSQIDERVALVVRGYDVRQAPIQVYLGLFDPSTHRMVAPAFPLFVGLVDSMDIETPEEGQEGSVKLRCVSQIREMTRANPDVRSGASQRARSSGDSFYDYTQNVGDWEIFWGKKRGKAA